MIVSALKILWLNFTFASVKDMGYGEGRERFWNNLNRVLDRVGNGY